MPTPESFPAQQARDLLAAARGGDRAALGRVMDLFRGYLLAIAEGELATGVRPKAQPSDMVQDAFLEAARAFDRFTGAEPEQFRAWLRTILLFKVSNTHKRYLDTAKRGPDRERSLDESGPQGTVLRDTLAGDTPTPSGAASRDEEARLVAAALDRLTQTDRQVIVWRNWDVVPFAEIGRRLGRSEDAARMLFARALERFQSELEQGHGRPPA
ncbi:MAG TPA: sigma-70 family RNA polymerase sigma factor [Urbifossiella sp.]|nr:sigma-70 family RNA polymerase sigma factor [Urbifossiella sp.]